MLQFLLKVLNQTVHFAGRARDGRGTILLTIWNGWRSLIGPFGSSVFIFMYLFHFVDLQELLVTLSPRFFWSKTRKYKMGKMPIPNRSKYHVTIFQKSSFYLFHCLSNNTSLVYACPPVFCEADFLEHLFCCWSSDSSSVKVEEGAQSAVVNGSESNV